MQSHTPTLTPWYMGGGDTEFYPKVARPPTSYDVTSRNHSNCFSPNLRQNVSKGYVYSYCKRQVLIKKIVLKKLKKNLMRGVDANPLSPVRLSFRLKVKPCAQLFSLKWRIQRVVSYHMRLHMQPPFPRTSELSPKGKNHVLNYFL